MTKPLTVLDYSRRIERVIRPTSASTSTICSISTDWPRWPASRRSISIASTAP